MLKDEDLSVALSTIVVLAETGDGRVVQPMIPILKHKDPSVRFVASETLIKIGPDAVLPLIAALNHKDFKIKIAAAKVLGRIGDRRAVPPLIAVLKGKVSDEVYMAVIKALGNIGDQRAVWSLIVFLRNKNSIGRYFAPDALVKIGSPAVQSLIDLLGDDDGDVVWLSMKTLGRIGDPRAVPALIDRMADQDPQVENLLVEILTTFGPEAVKPLIDEMINGDLNTQRLSTAALIKIGPPAVCPLINEIKKPDSDIRYLSAEVLEKIGSEAVQPLIDLIDEQDPDTMWRSIAILGKIGNKQAVAFLINKMSAGQPACHRSQPVQRSCEKKDPMIRFLSAEALIKIGGPSVDALFYQVIKAEFEIRHLAAQTLRTIGLPAVQPLIEKMKEDNPGVQKAAMELLRKIGGPAVPALINLLKEKDLSNRKKAVDILINIGTPSVQPLIETIILNDPETTWQAVAILGRIGDRWAVGPLLAALKSKNAVIRYLAAEALGRIGDQRAIGPLVAELSDWQIRHRVVTSLKDLGWAPQTETDHTYYLLAKGKKEELIPKHEDIRATLLRDLRSSNPKQIEYAVFAFIDLEGKRAFKRLSEYLNEDGDCSATEVFLNSGQSELVETAERWAKHRGYRVLYPIDARWSVWPCTHSHQYRQPIGWSGQLSYDRFANLFR